MPEISWWGHATVTIEDSGVRVLTDPILTPLVGHLRRRRGALPTPAALSADVVLISHLHGDHLHVRSLLRMPAGTKVLLPKGALRAIRALRLLKACELVEVSAGESLDFGPVTVRAVAGHHDDRRHVLARRSRAEPLGYVVEGAQRTYFAGDTDLFPEMADEVGGCDVALLPVGGWGPGLGPGHLNAVRAADAAVVVGASDAVPIHFGTLWPIGMDRIRPDEFLGPGHNFVTALAKVAPRITAHLLAPGQTVRLGP